jgi:hypothetical protein
LPLAGLAIIPSSDYSHIIHTSIANWNKILSVNSHTFIESNHGSGKVDESEMRGIGFFIPWNQLTEAVEPGMPCFDDPSAWLK